MSNAGVFSWCAGVIGLALLLARPAVADWPTDSLLNVPLCTATGDQWNPTITSDGAGGAIVAWCDYRSGNHDIYAQRVSAAGSVLWTVNGVALCTAAGDQQPPAIISDGAGGAIVTWRDERNGYLSSGIYAQRISAVGTVQWAANGAALCTANASLYATPAIASDGAGGAIVAWMDGRNGDYDIYAQRISSGGAVQWTANGMPVCAATGNQWSPTIVSDGAGGAIIAWRDTGSTNYDIYAQRISTGGAVQWSADGVALCTAAGDQMDLTITSDSAGGAIVAWYDGRSGYSNGDIYAQRIADDGAVLWPANGVAVCAAAAAQAYPKSASDGVGGAIVTWEDYRGVTSSNIYAQRISAAGVPHWTANGVALCTATGDQSAPKITSDGAGGAIIAWEDYRSGSGPADVYAQRTSAGGAVQWPVDGVALCTAVGAQWYPAVISDGAGGAIATWMDFRSGNADIYAQRVWADGTTPVLISFVSVDVGADCVRLTWLAGGNGGAMATVYRCSLGGEWARIGAIEADGTGYLRYTDRLAATATRVGYRLGIVDAGVEGFYGETWVDLPGLEGDAALAFALDPVRPNPSLGGVLTVHFTLPNAAAASLELLDVAGRRVAAREVGSLGAGPHALYLGEGRRLSPGIYLVRLRQGPNTRVTRAAVLE